MVDAEALGAERVVLRAQQLGHLRVVHLLLDLAVHEVGGDAVRLGIARHVGKGAEERERALMPATLELVLLLVRCEVGGVARRERPDIARGTRAGEGTRLGVDRLAGGLLLGRDRAVPGGNAEVRRALKDRQLLGLLGHDRDHLDCRRAGADHGNALAGEVHALMRPRGRVVPVTRVAIEALELHNVWHRQAAGRHHEEARLERAAARLDLPAVGVLVPRRGGYLGLELDVAA